MSSETSIAKCVLRTDERNDIDRSIIKAEAELQQIERDIGKLVERREEVTNILSTLRKTLVIHRILPGEIIGYILSLASVERISLPYKLRTTPPQIIFSHVCSKWREIALATSILWNNVEIVEPESGKWVQVAKQLLFNRTSMRELYLGLNIDVVNQGEMEKTLYDIILPLHVKKLHLTLSLSDPEFWSSQNLDDIVANVDEIALDLDFYESIDLSDAPQFFSKIRSLICREETFLLNQNLPWAHMQSLDTTNIKLPIFTVSDILRQSPLLEACKIRLDDEAGSELQDASEMLALPRLRVFHIIRNRNSSHRSLDAFLRSFECPNVTDLSLKINPWTREMYNIIRNHYNLHRLLKLKLSGYPYPINKVLYDAPALQELVIVRKFLFMDVTAIHGISSGTLGRHLTSLGLRGEFNVREMVNMVVARQRRVKEIVDANHSRHDQISGIKRIFMLKTNQKSYEEEFMDEIGELKKLGIGVYDHDSDDSEPDSESDWE